MVTFFEEFSVDYASLHYQVRDLQKAIKRLEKESQENEQTIRRLQNTEDPLQLERRKVLETRMEQIKVEQENLTSLIPEEWFVTRERFTELAEAERKARLAYRRNVEEAYQPMMELEELLKEDSGIDQLISVLEGLNNVIQKSNSKEATQAIKEVESVIGEVPGSYGIKSPLSKARRLFRKEEPDREKALEFLNESLEVLTSEIAWRKAAKLNVLPAVHE